MLYFIKVYGRSKRGERRGTYLRTWTKRSKCILHIIYEFISNNIIMTINNNNNNNMHHHSVQFFIYLRIARSVERQARRPGFDSWQGQEIFLCATASRQVPEPTQPPVQLVRGAFSQGVERPGREADHSPPSSAAFLNLFTLEEPLK
jgi:hypothetical protein